MRYSERYMETLKKVTEQINFGDTLKDRSFLVTGATGMIGSAFTDMLLYLNREKQLNLHVFAAVRNVNRAEKRFDGFWSSDELSFVPYRAGEEIKAEIRPDYIIHCAGNAHPTVYAEQPAETLMTNIQGTYGLLEFARNTDSVKKGSLRFLQRGLRPDAGGTPVPGGGLRNGRFSVCEILLFIGQKSGGNPVCLFREGIWAQKA